MVGACGMYRRQESCMQVFVGRPEGKRPLRRPRHRWKETIKKDLQKVEWAGMDCIDEAEDRYR